MFGLHAASHRPPTPAVGEPAPAFKLQDQDGKWHALADYKGKWVALYFYPKDDTPGCTTQACGFRDNIFALQQGRRRDRRHQRRRRRVAQGIRREARPALHAARRHATRPWRRRYGVLKTYMGVMEMARRDTFLIDPQGRDRQALRVGGPGRPFQGGARRTSRR
ncbi:MAG: redoxin domain-containing protein [Rhodopseudomonas palustris]|nr:redoxin domain-containing protein [Rhodopseudomonas palustris]